MTSPFEPLNTGTSSAGFLPSWERRLWNKAKIGISRYEVDIVPVSQGGLLLMHAVKRMKRNPLIMKHHEGS